MGKDKFSKTMFIIGAGAHVPYGLPSSVNLTDKIKSFVSSKIKIVRFDENLMDQYRRNNPLAFQKNQLCQYLSDQKLLLPEQELDENKRVRYISKKLDFFIERFAQSQLYSIDAYLNKKIRNDQEALDEVAKLGKSLVSYLIYVAEMHTRIGFHKFDWIQFIINQFLKEESVNNLFMANPPLIYTFNYDNLFERSIKAHMESHYNKSSDDAIACVKKLNIKHIYGDIGTLELMEVQDVLDYGNNTIRVIGEDRDPTSELDKLVTDFRYNLSCVDEVYFLGFGFDQINCKFLFGDTSYKDVKFYSTNIGLSSIDMMEINRQLKIKVNFFENEGSVDCLKLLKEVKPVFESRERPQPRVLAHIGGGASSWMG